MKKLIRPNSPACLDNEVSKIKKKKFYAELRNEKDNTIRPRWNTLQEKGVPIVRKKLLEMSDNCCSFCGKRLRLDVEHFLPKYEFPYLSYCWENLLTACSTCNQNRKGTYYPPQLKGKKIVENILSEDYPHDIVYNQAQILKQLDERLIEPSFDNPEDHLAFLPDFYYFPKTKIGSITYERFFNHKEVTTEYEKISNVVKKIVKSNEEDAFEIIKDLINIYGCEYIYLQYYKHWLSEKEFGLLI